MSTLIKKFVLKHTFKNVLNMKEDVTVYSDEEEHFGVPWRMYITRKDGHLSFYFNCPKDLETGKWSVETEYELKLISKEGNHKTVKCEYTFGNVIPDAKFSSYGSPKFIDWEEMKKNYLVNDKLTAEVHVTIKKMTGFYGPDSRKFDGTAKDISDFVITVGEKNFNVSQLLLASQSTHLKKLVLEDYKLTKTFRFTFIDADDFQKFLEVLYLDLAITESTVEAIVVIGVSLTVPSVIRRCEEYLIIYSEKSLKKKLQLADRYGLTKLKAHCLASIKSNADVLSVLPSDLAQMDRSMLETLLQKAVTVQ